MWEKRERSAVEFGFDLIKRKTNMIVLDRENIKQLV